MANELPTPSHQLFQAGLDSMRLHQTSEELLANLVTLHPDVVNTTANMRHELSIAAGELGITPLYPFDTGRIHCFRAAFTKNQQGFSRYYGHIRIYPDAIRPPYPTELQNISLDNAKPFVAVGDVYQSIHVIRGAIDYIYQMTDMERLQLTIDQPIETPLISLIRTLGPLHRKLAIASCPHFKPEGIEALEERLKALSPDLAMQLVTNKANITTVSKSANASTGIARYVALLALAINKFENINQGQPEQLMTSGEIAEFLGADKELAKLFGQSLGSLSKKLPLGVEKVRLDDSEISGVRGPTGRKFRLKVAA